MSLRRWHVVQLHEHQGASHMLPSAFTAEVQPGPLTTTTCTPCPVLPLRSLALSHQLLLKATAMRVAHTAACHRMNPIHARTPSTPQLPSALTCVAVASTTCPRRSSLSPLSPRLATPSTALPGGSAATHSVQLPGVLTAACVSASTSRTPEGRESPGGRGGGDEGRGGWGQDAEGHTDHMSMQCPVHIESDSH